MKNNSAETRRLLLRAANEIVLNDGVIHLTLEAVAAKAGISKGGLLYHFRTKEVMIESLIDYLKEGFSQDFAREFAAEENQAGGKVRAYIRASANTKSEDLNLSAGLLAAFANNPKLIEPFQKMIAETQIEIEQDGIDPVLATLLRLATDGLWMAEMFNVAPPTGKLREDVVNLMLELSKE
jgi:AcrR family transcriptional regulator